MITPIVSHRQSGIILKDKIGIEKAIIIDSPTVGKDTKKLLQEL